MARAYIYLILLFSIAAFINAEVISLNPCDQPFTYTEDAANYYIKSGCFEATFTKIYNGTPLRFYDTYNDDEFDLKLYSLRDVNVANENQKKTTSLETLGLTAQILGNVVRYTEPTGKYVLNYSFDENAVKASITLMGGWVSDYNTGRLELRTRIHKEDTALAHFENKPSIVDGIEQPLIVTEEINGVNKFYIQTLFVGKSFTTLMIDPIYYVDFAPEPAMYLINGAVATDDDGDFQYQNNVTATLSDNNTGTSVATAASESVDVPYSFLKDGGGNETSKVVAVDGTTIEVNVDFSAGKYGTITTEGGNYFTNGTILTLYMRPKDAAGVGKTLKFTTTSGTQVGSVVLGSSASLAYYYVTLSNIPAATSSIRFLESAAGDNYRVIFDYVDVDISDLTLGDAIATHFDTTYQSGFEYFLSIYDSTPGSNTIYVYAYQDTDSISSQYVTKSVNSVGYFTINVTSLVYYQTNTLSLPYTSFRIWTDTAQNIAEVSLREEINDSTPSSIIDCQSNTTTLDCGQKALLSCNVTDNLDVDEVIFTINGSNYTAFQVIDTFEVEFSPVQAGIYLWSDVFAYDILMLESTSSPNIFINNTCCIEDWQSDLNSCQIDDTILISYTDANNCGSFDDLPVDNGTYQACNYCSENLTKEYIGICHQHGDEGIIDYNWTDQNYWSCCAVTGIVTDCSVDYAPFNITQNESCIYTINDFEIQADLEALFGFGIGGLKSDKVSGKIYINDSNTTYYCISYVKTAQGDIVQTNPPYTKRTESTISLIPKEIEDREFFVTKNGLANVYWTDHNLIKDMRDYIFGVECASDSERLISEVVMSAGYKNINEPITRWFWVKENLVGIIAGFFIILIAILVGGWLWRQR
jgi:hypothetical protein